VVLKNDKTLPAKVSTYQKAGRLLRCDYEFNSDKKLILMFVIKSAIIDIVEGYNDLLF